MIASNTNNATYKYNKISKRYISGRISIAMFFAAVIIIGAIIVSRLNSNGFDVDINYMDFYNLQRTGYDSVLIVKGDTVDGLIDRYFNNYNLEKNSDIRKELKNEIMELNNLDRYATIYAGGYLLVPIYE